MKLAASVSRKNRHRFSAFWLRSKCSICSYQLNIWYVLYMSTSILNWFLPLGEMPSACTALATGGPGIAVPPGSAHSSIWRRIKPNKNKNSPPFFTQHIYMYYPSKNPPAPWKIAPVENSSADRWTGTGRLAGFEYVKGDLLKWTCIFDWSLSVVCAAGSFRRKRIDMFCGLTRRQTTGQAPVGDICNTIRVIMCHTHILSITALFIFDPLICVSRLKFPVFISINSYP